MMLKNASNQRGANSVTVLLHQLGTLVAWKDAFLENYLAIIVACEQAPGSVGFRAR